MERVRSTDLERQVLLERLSDPGVLPIITLGVGKGNFAAGISCFGHFFR